MRVLVTGASGFSGRHLLPALRAGGHEVFALSRGPKDRPVSGDVRGLGADLLKPAEVEVAVREAGPDGVIHLAGESRTGRGTGGSHAVLESFVLGTAHLFEALAVFAGHPRVVLVSSSAVYGTPPSPDVILTEEAPFRPATAYGAAKAAQELVAGQLARAGEIPLCIVRTFNLVGPSEPSAYVCASLARQVDAIASGGEPVVRAGRLDTTRDFVDVRDAAQAYVSVLERGQPGAIYNVCSEQSVSIRDVLDRLLRLAGLGPAQVRVEEEPGRRRMTDVLYQRGSAERLRAATGWRPRFSLDESLRVLLDEATGRPVAPAARNVTR